MSAAPGLDSAPRMPIYEFYCADCHTLFSFFSASVGTDRRPACPRCGRAELPRRPSSFATLKRSGDDDELDADDPFADLDDERMEKAMEALGSELDGLEGDDEPDPRQMSRMLRRFSEVTGLEAGPRLREMLERLDRGEDPEALEAEFEGDEGDDDLSELFQIRKKALARRARRPRVDDTLHFL